MKKCPNDHSELVSVVFNGVRVDECSKDKGIFFERTELDRAKNASDPDLKWLRVDLFAGRNNKFTKYKTHKKCPKDDSEMITLEYPYSKVKIEECMLCEGVWLEHGEFQKIITSLEKKTNELTSSEIKSDFGHELARLLEGTDDVGVELGELATLLKLYEIRLETEHPTLEKWLRDFIAYWPIH